jgi:hypothetical protein
MSKQRDDVWRRFQGWLSTSKRSDVMTILRRGDGKDFRKSIDMACKAFALDSTKPIDQILLLGIFADIHFPDVEGMAFLLPGYRRRKPPGRFSAWPDERKLMLRSDAATAGRHSPQTSDHGKIALRLKKPKEFGPFKGDWSKLKTSTLEKYLRRGPGKAKKSEIN